MWWRTSKRVKDTVSVPTNLVVVDRGTVLTGPSPLPSQDVRVGPPSTPPSLPVPPPLLQPVVPCRIVCINIFMHVYIDLYSSTGGCISNNVYIIAWSMCICIYQMVDLPASF